MVYKPPSLWHSVSLNRLRHNRNKTCDFQTEGWRRMTEGWAQTGQVVGTQNDGGREGREEAGGGGGDGGRG